MFNCEYCNRELRSNAGKVKHETSCKERPNKEVTLEFIGENNYYIGHPRRQIKLEGLLSRTFNNTERSKIMKMIIELRNADKE